MKNEVADGGRVSGTIGLLVEQLKREKVENAGNQRGRSPGRYAAPNNARGRSTSGNRAFGAGPDVSKLEAQLGELRRALAAAEDDNDKLKDTMREMVDDYTRQLELRDETIQRLENAQPSQLAQQAKQREINDLHNEVRVLRDKNNQLLRDLDHTSNSNASRVNQLMDENSRLNRLLAEREKQKDLSHTDLFAS